MIALTLSCAPHRPVLTREAFLTFDNLTGDASLNWIAQSAPQLLAEDLSGVPKIVALTASTVRDAYLTRADRLVHGYYEKRSGKLHFEISVEDAVTHRTVQTARDDGAPGDALNRAAKSLGAGAHPTPAGEAAVEAWGQGEYKKAVELDPGFGLAWRGWVQQLAASGDQAGALAVAERAVAERAAAQPAPASLGASLEKARLNLAVAELRHDDAARLAALRDLSALIPYDPSISVDAAGLEMSARNFAGAVTQYRLAAGDDPSNRDLLNSLGYAEGLAGDLAGARKTFEEYGRGPGQDPVNALDSLGEALFVNGHFDEAERQFLDAYKKDPSFLQGETLWKAAHARWLADPGQTAAADRIAEQFFELRTKAHDPLIVWRRATWLYETGRRQPAQELLMHPAANPTAASFAQQQLTLWSKPLNLNANAAAVEETYRRSDPINDGLPRVLYAEVLLNQGKKDEARQLLKRWPLPLREDSPFASLLFPKFLELRKLSG